MAVQWPSTLPSIPLESGLSEAPQDQLLRSSMSAGPGKERRRFTAGVVNNTLTFRMSTAQVAIFESWYDEDLHAGALRFDLTHYRKQVVKEFKFTGPYKITPRPGGGGFYNVACPVKEMP